MTVTPGRDTGPMRSLLRDALCGLGAYARSFAPEFQLVAVVAPTMTVEQALKVPRYDVAR